MKKIIGLLSFLGAGIVFALPIPQPIILVPKKTLQTIEDKANYQLVIKGKTYTLAKYKRYRLASGETFQTGLLEVKGIDKECLYKYYPSTGKWELISCGLEIYR